ncbi:hypothetical protein EVAR_46093_1 [Eumeta japonica]|uniref:Uncharacterized protein n=1 Tax=Eumeta variegata TaxID=151549 RepID=A0A4C1XI05_EUMVA|nr:hypothetical protein EVAR_46093_1 [Eumeta japonica]
MKAKRARPCTTNGKGENQKGLCQANMGRVKLPIEAFPAHNKLNPTDPIKYREEASEPWIFGFANDVDAWPGLPYDFLHFGLS